MQKRMARPRLAAEKRDTTSVVRGRRGPGATEERVGDRTGPGAGFDISAGARPDSRGKTRSPRPLARSSK